MTRNYDFCYYDFCYYGLKAFTATIHIIETLASLHHEYIKGGSAYLTFELSEKLEKAWYH